jgi:hypothetical protein
MTSIAGVWERLAAAGIVRGTAPPAAEEQSPWYVTAMLGVAAWLSALFLLAFVAIALSDLLRNATSAIVTGALLCVVAIAMLRIAGSGVFATQLAIAASLAGQMLVMFGILEEPARDAVSWTVIAVFEAILVAVAPQYMHRVLATLGAAVALRMALGASNVSVFFPAVVAAAFVAAQGATPQRLLRDSLWGPVSTGLALALLLVIPSALLDSLFFATRRSALFVGIAAWAGTAAVACIFVASIGRLLREAGIGWRSRAGAWALAGGILLSLAAWPVPGVVVALIVLLEAFAAGRRTLAGLAVVALLAALAHYYYALQAPLLVKAAALAATGVVLLGARFALRFARGGGQEADHA